MAFLSKKYDRYLNFFKFVLKYWNNEIFSETHDYSISDELLGETPEKDLKTNPVEFVEDLKKMGPVYIKLGQLLSTRPDMLPKPFLRELTALQEDVDPIPFEQVKDVIEAEFGQPINRIFKTFEEIPLASASIGQVHEAELSSGDKVAVKIQRPGVKKRFVEDIEILLDLSEQADKWGGNGSYFSIHEVVEELQYILMQELDYGKEAQNLNALKHNMEEFSYLKVPEVYDDYSTRRVLTMEYIKGYKITDKKEVLLTDMPREEMVNDFVKGYLKQIIIDGFAHADPHPGNIKVVEEGKLALLDLGMVVRFSLEMRRLVMKLLLGLSSGDGDYVSRALLEMSNYDEQKARVLAFKKEVNREVQENNNKSASELRNGKAILNINKKALQLNIKLPVELISLGKILLNMDQILAVLAPNFKLQSCIKGYVNRMMRSQLFGNIKPENLLYEALESKELLENLPYRINKITNDLAENNFRIKMDTFDEDKFLGAFQKVANRIGTAVVVAALILSGALVMRAPSGWMWWGYPGFAVLLFIFAAVIGFYLVYQILLRDRKK